MKIEIFTEGSGTTADRDDVETVLDFFEGGFLPVRDLAMDLEEHGNTTIHVLSDEFGYVRGSDGVTTLSDSNTQDEVQQFSQAILQASHSADVLVILLTKSTFDETVSKQWSEMLSNVNESSICCLGASRSALSSIEIEKLYTSVDTVIVYHRVGVARISSEYKKQLVEAVSKKSSV